MSQPSRRLVFHALYFGLCHGAEAGRASVHNLSGVAQSLGYRAALAQSKLEPLARVEDIMSAQMSADARLPQGMEQRLERLASLRAISAADRGAVAGRLPPPEAPAVEEPESTGIMAGPRRLTNRAFDALNEFGSWVFGR